MLNTVIPIFSTGAGAATGDFESIATVTVGSGGAANVEFTSIGTDWTHLQIRFIARASSVQFVKITLNGNTTGSNYYAHSIIGNGSTATANAWNGTSYNAIVLAASGLNTEASEFNGGVIDILDYTSTNKNKTLRWLQGFDSNGTGDIEFGSGLFSATPAAITSIKLALNSGNFTQYSHFALYGIKSA